MHVGMHLPRRGRRPGLIRSRRSKGSTGGRRWAGPGKPAFTSYMALLATPLSTTRQSLTFRRTQRLAAPMVALVIAASPGALRAQSLSESATGRRDPRPFAALSNSAMSMRDSIVAVARAQIGTRYRFGGQSPDGGFDCSGLVRYVLAALKVALPRTAAQQATLGAAVDKDTTRLRPGDLLTFGRSDRVTHIGIYVGDGRYVHASPTAGRVIETSLARTRSPLVKSWRGGRRVLADGEAAQDTLATPTP